jgi:hypothetical protein
MGDSNNVEIDAVSVNREIKDGVFRLLFDDPEKAAELYYALSGDKCSPNEIQIITITTTVSGEHKNDLAFVVRGKVMVVGEHMSSPYANMPVRLLMYVGVLLEKWIKMKGEENFIYSSKLYKIPTPGFVVFYNGTTNRPEKEILRLSSAFEGVPDKNLGFLELEVPVYNINKGMNEGLFDKSPNLGQYSEFISKLREFNKLYDDYARAVKEAVSYCIDNGILAEFLKEQGGKIVSILSTYDPEVAKRVYAEERVEDERIEIARSMLAKGYPVSAVSEITRVSESEVLRLQEECTL